MLLSGCGNEPEPAAQHSPPAAASPAPGKAGDVDAKAMEASRNNAVKNIRDNPNLSAEQKERMARQLSGTP
jgi:hypothetical protein